MTFPRLQWISGSAPMPALIAATIALEVYRSLADGTMPPSASAACGTQQQYNVSADNRNWVCRLIKAVRPD